MRKFGRIYLDYAATTPVDPRVLEAMQPYFSEKYGNAGSLHSFGQEAMAAVDKARAAIGKAIAAAFGEIIFTGSATEANNLALRGVVKSYQHKSAEISINQRPRLIISAIEHESVLETTRDLEREGVEVIYLPVEKDGLVNLKALKNSLNERTILVSVMYANNEIGIIQSISEISKILRNFRDELGIKNKESGDDSKLFIIHNSLFPFFHTDAVQAFQYLDCAVNRLGVDLMTLSAHKIYGPKGIAALYIRSDLQQLVSPIVVGGGQEFGLRSGTENVPAIVGFAKAAEIAVPLRESESERVRKLRDYFWAALKKIYPKAEVNGMMNKELEINDKKTIIHNSPFILPNILNVYFPDHKAEDLLIKFDLAGIAVSSGSACSARSTRPSHVLQALGFPPERIKSSIRFSLGRFTTKEELQEVLSRINSILRG